MLLFLRCISIKLKLRTKSCTKIMIWKKKHDTKKKIKSFC